MIPRNIVNNSALYEELKNAFDDVVWDESYVYGEYVSAFERAFVKKFGHKYGVAVANTTVATSLLFSTFGATYGIMSEAAYIGLWLGGRRVSTVVTLTPQHNQTWDTHTYSYIRILDELKIHYPRRGHSPIAIISHLYGSRSMVDITALKKADKYLPIIEDMSHSHGLTPHPLTDAVIYSLYPTKPFGGLTDGAIITTNNAGLANRLRSNSFYGYDNYQDMSPKSSNFKMDNMSASFLRAKLRTNTFDTEMTTRIKYARIYQSKLMRLQSDAIVVPEFSTDCVFHMMPLYVKDREKFTAFMAEQEIEVGRHYPLGISVAQNNPSILATRFLEKTSNWNEHVVTLPLSAWHTEKEIIQVCDAITKYCTEKTNVKTN